MSFLSKLHKLLIWPDSLGPDPRISHKGKGRYQTLLGSFLTIFAIFLCFSGCFWDFFNIFMDAKPSIDTIEEKSFEPVEFDYRFIDRMKIHFQFDYFDLQDMNFKTINKTDYPTVSIMNNTSQLFDEKNQPIFLTDCQSEFFEKRFYLYYDFFGNKEYIVPYYSEPKRNQTFSSDELKDFMDSSICFPNKFMQTLQKAKLDSDEKNFGFYLNYNYIKNLKLKYKTPQINLVIKSYKGFILKNHLQRNPYVLQLETDKIKIYFDNYQEYDINLQNKIVWVDNNYFKFTSIFEDDDLRERDLFLEISNYEEKAFFSISSNTNITNIARINFVLDDSWVTQKITYIKIEDILGDLGGFASIFFPLLEAVTQFLVFPFYSASRINCVFKFHENISNEKDINSYAKDFFENLQQISPKNLIKKSKYIHTFNKPKIKKDALNNLDQSNNSFDNLNNSLQNIEIDFMHQNIIPHDVKNIYSKPITRKFDNDKNPQIKKKKLIPHDVKNIYSKPIRFDNDKNPQIKKNIIPHDVKNIYSKPISRKFDNDKNPQIKNNEKYPSKLDNSISKDSVDSKLLYLEQKFSPIINSRKSVKIRSFDVLRFCCCSRFETLKKSVIIGKCLDILDESLNEENFALNSSNDLILKNIVLESAKKDLFIIPSINIENEKTCKMLFNHSTDDTHQEYNDKDLRQKLGRFSSFDLQDKRNQTLVTLYLMDNL